MKLQIMKEALGQLADVSDEAWNSIIDIFHHRELRKNEFFVCQGDATDMAAFVLSGSMRMYFIGPNGEDYTKNFMFGGDFIGAYQALLEKTKARCYIQAMEFTELICFNYSLFCSNYNKHPCWQQIGRKIAEKQFLIKEKREYEFLMLQAQERYENFLVLYEDKIDRIPKKFMASYLGINISTLSRIIHRK